MARVSRTITIRLRRPTHITLAFVSSDTDFNKKYEIALDRQNLVYCNCKSWRYNHSCKHLTAFRQSLASAREQVA